MKAGQRSRTADAAAAIRASHARASADPVFHDPYAQALTSRGWQTIVQHPLLHRFISPQFFPPLGRLVGQVVGRARYAEDLLVQAVARGVQQYVLVGAGLDSFLLRQGADFPDLTIFEVDHPDTQAGKQAQLAKLGAIPANVVFVPINFERESIAEALQRSRYQPDQPAFFSWLGVTHYLTPETTLATLKAIAKIAASGSEVVFDYSIPYHQLSGIERWGAFAVSKITQYLSEPLKGQLIPPELHVALAQMGFDVVEDLAAAEQNQRLFHPRRDHIQATAATRLIHIRKC